MGILCAGLGLESAGLAGIVLGAVVIGNKGGGCVQRLLGKTQGVGTHVGDKTNTALTADLNALIKLLGDGHGASGGHAEAA